MRFGAERVFAICEAEKVEIVILNQGRDTTFEEDLAKDVLESITVSSARLWEAVRERPRNGAPIEKVFLNTQRESTEKRQPSDRQNQKMCIRWLDNDRRNPSRQSGNLSLPQGLMISQCLGNSPSPIETRSHEEGARILNWFGAGGTKFQSELSKASTHKRNRPRENRRVFGPSGFRKSLPVIGLALYPPKIRPTNFSEKPFSTSWARS